MGTNFPSLTTRNWNYSTGQTISQWEEQGVFCATLNSTKGIGMTLVKNTSNNMKVAVQSHAAVLPQSQYVVVSGPFTATSGSDPVGTILGDLIERGTSLASYPYASKQNRAYLAYRKSASGIKFEVGIGTPPSSADLGVGGLCPLVIKGAKNTTSDIYQEQKSRGRGVGKSIFALRSNGLVLLAVQPDHTIGHYLSTGGTPLDDVTDELATAGFTDAVLFDGSDSVMMYHNSTWMVPQGSGKNTVLRYAFCFA